MKKKKARRQITHRKAYTALAFLMAFVAVGFLVMLILLNTFPKGMTLGLVAFMMALLIIAPLLFGSRKKGARIAGIVLSAIYILVFVFATVFMGNTYAMINNISADTGGSVSSVSNVDVSEDAFNVYITGIDQWNSEKGLDLERSDVNMIVTVCPSTHKVVLTSIPRDAYIPLHRTGTMDKLTHTGIYGVDETLSSVHDWLGLEMDYYVKVNFNACVDIVDAIGGIEVDSPKTFKSKLYDHTYTKGINHLNGKEALYYARERAAFNGEDQIRVKNQLQVMEAVIHKITSSTTLLTSYGSIMETLGDEMETNMPSSDIRKLIKMQLADMRGWDVETQRMTGSYDMAVVASMNAKNEYSVLKVDNKSKQSCLEKISATMDPTEEELEAAENERKKATVKNMLKSVFDKDGNGDSSSE